MVGSVRDEKLLQISAVCLAASVLPAPEKPAPVGQGLAAAVTEAAPLLLTPSMVLKQKNLYGQPAFSPSGERLLSPSKDGIVAWGLASGTRAGPSFTPEHRGSWIARFSYTPDGRQDAALFSNRTQ
jgi:hypothetical protein